MDNRIESGCSKSRMSLRKEMLSSQHQFSMKTLLQSTQQLCNVTLGQHWKGNDSITEVTFLGFSSSTEDEDLVDKQALAAIDPELSGLLNSLQLHKLKNTEIALLTGLKKHSRTRENTVSQHSPSEMVCVMRHPPASLKFTDSSVFSALSKYTRAIQFSLDGHSALTLHTEDDDTNQSVSSIEDDFVTAFEHLEEEEAGTEHGTAGFDPKHQDSALQAFTLDTGETITPGDTPQRLAFDQSALPLLQNSRCSRQWSSAKSSVTTLSSDPGKQRSFYRQRNAPIFTSSNRHKCVPSVSPSESEDSGGSSPSPVIFLDEEGYQKSLKANLELPQIPILKDDIEDSDSELSEFFDSFDQFDDLSEMLVGTAVNLQHGSDPQNPLLRNNSTAKLPSDFTLQQCATAAAAMNPQRFDQPVLPANVKKPTARKAESPYNNLSDVPDSPRPMSTSGEDSSPLFSPVHSSAFSPLAACGNSEGFGRVGASDTHIYHVLNLGGLSNTSSNDVSNVPHCIKGSVFKYPQTSSSEQRGAAGSTQDIHWSGGFAYLGKPASIENSNMKDCTLPQQKCSNVLKDGIQRIATELVEKSLGGAFKDLQKGVTSCTSTLCHLAARLTSSVIHMALQEIGTRQAFARRRTAINCLADYLVGDAISGAFQELEFVKKQIFNNAVARFATDLAEELVFEGIMEVCQFSHPPTPTSITSWSLEDEAKVVSCYARDLSESVLQEAFIELSQVDVTFTPQAAISISLDNIKDVGGEDVTQALKIVNDTVNVKEEALLRHPEGCYTDAVAGKDLFVLHSPEADYKITKAFLWVSGILSCVSVPSVVKTLACDFSDSALHSCCHRISSKVKLEQAPKSSPARPGSRSRKVDKVSPVSCVHQLVNQANSANCSGYVFCDTMNLCMEPSDCETSRKIEGLDTNEASPTIDKNCQTTVAMLDFVVNNAFDLVTVPKVEYEVEEYASQLSKKILFKPVSESPPVSQKHFAAHLAEAIVRNSVNEVKTKAMMPYKDGGSQADVETSQAPAARLQEIPEGQMLDQFSVRKLISDGQHQDVCSQSPDLLRTPPVSPNECIPGKHLTIPQHFAQELKGHLAEEFPPCTPPPSPTVGLKNLGVDSTEGVRGPELADSLMSLTEHLQGQALMSTFQTHSADINGPNQELSLGLLGNSRAGLNKDGLFSEERLDHVEGSGSPETPPPTPQQSFHGKSLRSFSRKLKGELAKEFMPVTPPSTPHNHSAPSMAVMTQDTEQKAEFVLKLMRSLSEEVLDNEDDDNFDFAERHSESREQPSPRWETKVLEKEELKLDIKRHALHYANQLASSIVSMATEIAAICVEDANKCDASKIRSFRVPPSSLWRSAARSELHTWGSGAEIKFPEEVVGSLWSYAGKVAGEVIRDAKKILSSKKQKVRKFRKDVGQAESSESSYGEQEHVGGEGLNTLADHWSQELVDSVHHSPSGSAPGLMSKHSSCESVTDEYAEYIMRMISREGGNGEVIVDHYASKLAFRTVKVGLEQAARRIRQKYKRRLLSCQQSKGEDGTKELLKFLTREDAQDGDLCSRGHDQRLSRKDSRDLTRFAESVAQTITYEVTQKLKTASGIHGLPKSLTDSCLYERSQLEQMAEGLIKKTWTCSIKPIIQRNKRFHSTGSLDNYSHSIDSTNRALEHYVGKSVDSAVQLSMAETGDEALESRKQRECLAYAEKLTEMVLKCSLTDKESRSYISRLSSQTTALCSKNATRMPWLNSKALSKAEHSVHRTVGACQLDVPRIHIELEQRGLFPEDLMSVAIEKAKRDLSNTSLAADSGIGQEGASFTESLAAEIMTSAMISASQSIVSASLKDGMRSSDSTTSQQLSLSVGDDSTGSWSNLSFEDEHPDETSSFLHLSDSNGNSSSWSSLGLEGDIYEENISFPPSDSDNSEDREEEVQEDSEGMMQVKEILSILNIDLEPCSHDPQMRAVLQWIAASQSPVSLVYFKECYENELLHFPAVVRRAEVRSWKVCDLLQAVLRYCNDAEQHPTGGHYIRTPLFDWLLENT